MNRVLSTAFGLVMVAIAAVQASDVALVVCGVSTIAVLAANIFRACATVAVAVVGVAVLLGDVPPMLAALCGLTATGYLVLRHTTTVGAATVVGALGFTAIVLAAVVVPLRLPWVPLLVPVVVLAVVVLATRPFWAEERRR